MEEDAVAGIADPADVEFGGAAGGDDVEAGTALLVGAVVLDALEEGDHLWILEAGVEVLADVLEEVREVFRLGADGGAAEGGVFAFEFGEDFLRGGLGHGVGLGPAALEQDEESDSHGDHEGTADVEESGQVVEGLGSQGS